MAIDSFVAGLIFSYFLVFARLGSALMFLPGFGEIQIPIRARLSFALVMCAALLPAVQLPAAIPDGLTGMALMLGLEVTIGMWIGLCGRVLLASMQFAGYQIGQVSGLANAFGPSFGSFEGATMVATLMLISAVALIFITDTHHLMLMALLASYDVFPPGMIMVHDLADQMVRVGAHSLYIGTAIAAPFFVMGVVLNLGMGLANRLMPQLPVFFVAASMLIGFGLLIFALSMPSILEYYILQFHEWLMGFRV